MTTDQIRYFLALANRLNFRAVAERFFITQPTLSRQIAALEEELGVKLFERSTRGVELTEAGRTLYAELPDIHQALAALVGRTQEAAVRDGDHLSIALQDDQLLSEEVRWAVQQFSKQHPETRIGLHRVPVNELYDGLVSQKYDFANCLVQDGQYLQHFSYLTLSIDDSCIALQRELAAGYGVRITPEEVDELSHRIPIHLMTSDHFENTIEPTQALRDNLGLAIEEGCCQMEGDPTSIELKISAGLCITVVNRSHIMQTDPHIALLPVEGSKPYRKALMYLKFASNPAAAQFLEVLSKADSRDAQLQS
jgi:DNA-binding transcriptional LysR family regulator